MTRRTIAAAVLAAAALLAACAPTVQAPADGGGEPARDEAAADLTIGLTYTPDIQFAPWYVADAQGYFADEGVEVTLRHHGASESLFGALEAGEEDVVVAGGDEMLQARSQGIPVVNIATVYHSYPVALIVPDDSPITAPGELAGHTVGIPGPFGETWFGLLALLSNAGLGEDDVTVDHIGFTQQAALSAGHVDAVMGYVNNDAVQFEAAGLAVRTLPLDETGEVPLVGIGLGASETAIDDDPEALRAVVAATDRAIDDILADPEQALTLSADYVSGLEQAEARDAALETLEATSALYTDAATDRAAQWQEMAQFMAEHDLLGEDVDAESAVSDEFLP